MGAGIGYSFESFSLLPLGEGLEMRVYGPILFYIPTVREWHSTTRVINFIESLNQWINESIFQRGGLRRGAKCGRDGVRSVREKAE